MKKTILSILMLFLIHNIIYAQTPGIKIGAKTGLNISSVTNADLRTGFHIGAVTEIFFTEKFSIQPEILYSSQGANEKDPDLGPASIFVLGAFKHTIKLDYINIPLIAKYYLVNGLNVQAGPQLGILIAATRKNSALSDLEFDTENESAISIEDDLKKNSNTIDFGFNLGMGYEFPIGLFTEARYTLGLTSVPKSKEFGDYKNQVFQRSVGYKF